jgi:hypothetical protein
VLTTGHNSDGKFIARAQRIEYDCELVPRRVAIFIEKTKDGQILPVPNVVVRDVACGANHTVSLVSFSVTKSHAGIDWYLLLKLCHLAESPVWISFLCRQLADMSIHVCLRPATSTQHACAVCMVGSAFC